MLQTTLTLGKALRYTLNQWEHLIVYLCDGRVEIDNNSNENAIRPTAIGKKNWIFIGSGEAGEKTAILYTIVENCRRLGIAPAEYFADVMERLPGMTAREGNRRVARGTPGKAQDRRVTSLSS